MDDAKKRWLDIPESLREKIIQNVFCRSCLDETTIVDYEIEPSGKNDVILNGSCKKCGHPVRRYVENDF
ncbi:hypothetical protein DX933_09745 [Ornithinibacillus gellani]|uniref:hypothetical protein n=1 Tax=Ornithinibacillus gellani TaxID=2293253 RepID=UPI000F49931D|nr:hypothetical protein [Ornithinibacillus gellani]TQS75029.1 hypothetical protein DX933_09745 [Ornithinibacillus gellani]